jgi:hypothetical protein
MFNLVPLVIFAIMNQQQYCALIQIMSRVAGKCLVGSTPTKEVAMTTATKPSQKAAAELDFNQLSPDALLRPYDTWYRNTERMQKELMRFWGKRLREDMELPARIAECSNAGEVLAKQVSFAGSMFNDYAAENLKLLEIACDTFTECEEQAEAALTGPLEH